MAARMNLRILWFGPLPTALLAGARGAHPGLEVDYLRTRSSDQQFDLLVDGSVDAVVTAIDNVVEWNRRAPEADFRVFAQVERSTDLALFGRPGLAGIEDLRSPRLLVDAPQNGFAVALLALLAQAGIAPRACALEPAGGVTERLEALLAGKGDSTLLGPPFDQAALDAGCPKLASVNEVWPDFPGQGLIVSRRRFEALEAALVQWLRAMEAVRSWMAGEPDEAIASLCAAGLPQAFAARAAGLVPKTWTPDAVGLALLIEHRRIVGLSGTALEYDDLVDLSLVEQV